MASPFGQPDDQLDEIGELKANRDIPKKKTSSLRGVVYAITGFDSNVELTSNDIPSSAVLKVGGEIEYAHRLFDKWVMINQLSLDSNLWQANNTGGTLVAEARTSIGGFIFGNGKIRRLGRSAVFPRLRILIGGRYQIGSEFLGASPSRLSSASASPANSNNSNGRPETEDPADPPEMEDPNEPPDIEDPNDTPEIEDPNDTPNENEDLTEAEDIEDLVEDQLEGSPVDESSGGDGDNLLRAAAFVDPFHRLTAEARLRFDLNRTFWFEVRPRYIRALSPGRLGQANRNFDEFEARLMVAYRISRIASLRASYQYEERVYSNRINDFGEPLIFVTHRPVASMFFRLNKIRLSAEYQLRYREINDPGRNRVRNGVALLGEYRFTKLVSCIAEVAFMAEERIGREDRDWNRLFAIAGVQFAY